MRLRNAIPHGIRLSIDRPLGAIWDMSVNCNGGIFKMKKLAFAAALTVAFSGNAFAQAADNGPTNGNLTPSYQIVGNYNSSTNGDRSYGPGSSNVIVGGCPGTCIPTVKGSMTFPLNAAGLVTAYTDRSGVEVTVLGKVYRLSPSFMAIKLNGVTVTNSNKPSLLGANCSIVGEADSKIETVGNEVRIAFSKPRYASMTCTK